MRGWSSSRIHAETILSMHFFAVLLLSGCIPATPIATDLANENAFIDCRVTRQELLRRNAEHPFTSRLEFIRCGFSVDALLPVARFANLDCIEFHRCRLGENAFGGLNLPACMTRLKAYSTSLKGCGLGVALSKSNVQFLTLENCEIDEEFLGAISTLALSELSVRGCRIDESMFNRLLSLDVDVIFLDHEQVNSGSPKMLDRLRNSEKRPHFVFPYVNPK